MLSLRRRWPAWLRRSWRHDAPAPHGLILLYHSIADVATDPWSISVTPSHFAEHLEVLRRHACPVRLAQIVDVDGGGVIDGAVAVSFDDGYANNLHTALPLLERHAVPATVFVISGLVGEAREFWWHELELLSLELDVLPPNLRLRVANTDYDWALGPDAVRPVDPPKRQRQRPWRAYDADAPTARHTLFRELYELLRSLPAMERQEVLGTIRAWAGASGQPRADKRPVSAAELRALAASDLIDIGAHTITHPRLSTLSARQQHDEIAGSRVQLEQLLERSIPLFAYPFGGPDDVTAETVAMTREAGFRAACMNVPGVVGKGADIFRLPRAYVVDCDGESFARQLRAWLKS